MYAYIHVPHAFPFSSTAFFDLFFHTLFESQPPVSFTSRRVARTIITTTTTHTIFALEPQAHF